jgi:hypothetical protein
MSKRLQVLLEEEEYEEIREHVRERRMTMAEWVRQALRAAFRQASGGDPRRKLLIVREACRHRFPAPDIDRMLSEIERGYIGEASE